MYCERHGLAPACQRLGRVATLVDTLAEVRAVGDVAVLRYALSSRFEVDHA